MIKIVQRETLGHFAFRVLEIAQAEAMEMIDTHLEPIIADAESTGETLVVISDDNRDLLLKKAPVEITVMAPGGQVMAADTVTRGEKARFATSDWPPGSV